jgi:hypothetical protein
MADPEDDKEWQEYIHRPEIRATLDAEEAFDQEDDRPEVRATLVQEEEVFDRDAMAIRDSYPAELDADQEAEMYEEIYRQRLVRARDVDEFRDAVRKLIANWHKPLADEDIYHVLGSLAELDVIREKQNAAAAEFLAANPGKSILDRLREKTEAGKTDILAAMREKAAKVAAEKTEVP